MTDKFKKRVREHAEKHGMTYQAARQQLETGPSRAREPRVARATLYTGENVTIEVVREGDGWGPRSAQDGKLFRRANFVALGDEVLKDRHATATAYKFPPRTGSGTRPSRRRRPCTRGSTTPGASRTRSSNSASNSPAAPSRRPGTRRGATTPLLETTDTRSLSTT